MRLPLFTLALVPYSALASDFTGLGHLLARNASYALYPSDIKLAGCITDNFLWTLNKTNCGLFHGSKGNTCMWFPRTNMFSKVGMGYVGWVTRTGSFVGGGLVSK